jgi:hypothetical protein
VCGELSAHRDWYHYPEDDRSSDRQTEQLRESAQV